MIITNNSSITGCAGFCNQITDFLDDLKGVDVQSIFEGFDVFAKKSFNLASRTIVNICEYTLIGLPIFKNSVLPAAWPFIRPFLYHKIFENDTKHKLFMQSQNLKDDYQCLLKLGVDDPDYEQKKALFQAKCKSFRSSLDHNLIWSLSRIKYDLKIVDRAVQGWSLPCPDSRSLIVERFNEFYNQFSSFFNGLKSAQACLTWFFFIFGVLDQTPDFVYHISFNLELMAELALLANIAIKLVEFEMNIVLLTIPVIFLTLLIAKRCYELRHEGFNYFVIPRLNEQNEYTLETWKVSKLGKEIKTVSSEAIKKIHAKVVWIKNEIPEIFQDVKYFANFWKDKFQHVSYAMNPPPRHRFFR